MCAASRTASLGMEFTREHWETLRLLRSDEEKTHSELEHAVADGRVDRWIDTKIYMNKYIFGHIHGEPKHERGPLQRTLLIN